VATVGAVGVRIDVVFLNEDGTTRDLTGATTIDVYVTRPDLTEQVLTTAAFDTDGTDGAVYALSTAGTFTVAGRYACQGYVVDTTAAFTGFSSSYYLDVTRSPTVV
jgi:hypothetical protein